MRKMVAMPLMLIVVLAISACAQMPVPPAGEPVPAATQPAAAPEPTKDVVETAVEAGNFNTLVTAVEAAGLVDALKAEGPYTVFAPTDVAFAALPEGTLESLLNDTETLSGILLYHVVPGKIMAADVRDGLEAETLQGSMVEFAIDGDQVMINDANIIATDIETSNGVIHVIDAVILPAQ